MASQGSFKYLVLGCRNNKLQGAFCASLHIKEVKKVRQWYGDDEDEGDDEDWEDEDEEGGNDDEGLDE